MTTPPQNRDLSPSLAFERALRMAAVGHRDQVRKGSGVPYVEHPMAVALILDRAGFAEEVTIAGLLHDLVEDTDVTLDQIRQAFGDQVAELVASCSEVKLDDQGRKRPWIDRKQGHLLAVRSAPSMACAVILADKLHNLMSIWLDLVEGRPVWDNFHASRDQVLWYHQAMIDACESSDPRVSGLVDECRKVLREVIGFEVKI